MIPNALLIEKVLQHQRLVEKTIFHHDPQADCKRKSMFGRRQKKSSREGRVDRSPRPAEHPKKTDQ